MIDDPIYLSDEIDGPVAALSKFAPTSPGELFLALIFIFPSIIFILYLVRNDLLILSRLIFQKNPLPFRL